MGDWPADPDALRRARALLGTAPTGPCVIAADRDVDGLGRVTFAMRTTAHVNLVEHLRSLPLGPVEGEYGFGHPAATGGSLSPRDFGRLLSALGFQDERRAAAS